tara:strand:+ start:173 stop:838 length:666 start_codon:yes stop_codon:yes gene_type:complete
MDRPQILDDIEEVVTQRFAQDATGHDINHLRRVTSLALRLAEEEGADTQVVGAAALLHDLHRLMELESGHYRSAEESLPLARSILEEVGFPIEEVDDVLYCIAHHEDYSFTKRGIQSSLPIEAIIIQDADNLDAMGAIGIARCFMFSGAHDTPMGDPGDHGGIGHYNPAQQDGSAVAHFHEKLLKLKDDIRSRSAKRQALERHNYMVTFLERLSKEWAGEL